MLTAIGLLTLGAWIYLLLAHGAFWRARERLPATDGSLEFWPAVVAIVPARDEAAFVGEAVASLLGQDYPGSLHVVLVDDESSDDTAARARDAAAAQPERLLIEPTPPRPDGWVGKMWAVHHGVRAAERTFPRAALLWLTDADIVHQPDNLRRLVVHTELHRLDLVSLMAKLEAKTGWERLLVPAFVYFFQLLYPFARVNDPRHRTAAAAGGCMLVRRSALAEAGGIESIRGELIDDCALARRIKRNGPIWLGLGESARSIRGYGGLRGVWSMVARTAFTQLRYSWILLALTIDGLVLLLLAAPLLVLSVPLHGNTVAAAAGGAAWLIMAWSFAPTLALYGRSAWWGLALPVAGSVYTAMTFDSARRHSTGHGGEWKGRTQSLP